MAKHKNNKNGKRYNVGLTRPVKAELDALCAKLEISRLELIRRMLAHQKSVFSRLPATQPDTQAAH